MKNPVKQIWQRSFLFAIFFLQCIISPAHTADAPGRGAGLAETEALRLGEAIYLNGMSASGEPVQAKLVDRDMTGSGKSVACVACHLRSGLGSLIEDEILVLPVSGTKLYAPLLDQQDIPGTSMKRTMFTSPRPAYSDETLAGALLTGKDPTGRDLNKAMPRYLLDAASVQAMVSYLKNLSINLSPGLAEDEIRFATIVTEGISGDDREAMVRPLTAFLQEEWNGRLSVLAKRSNIRVSQGDQPLAKEKRFRRASLDVWELHGPAETWTEQLETLYDQRPVFAILGGLAASEWSPIHRFCEKNKIPCILPITDLPVVAASDWYTLYFSKGFFLEGEVAARFLAENADLAPGTPVIQVSRDTERGKALARGFSDTWKKVGKARLTSLTLPQEEQTGSDFWKKLSAATPPATLVVWLESADLAGIESLADHKPPALFLSGTQLGDDFSALPEAIRDFTFIDYPRRLPGDGAIIESMIASWMKMKNIPVINMAITSKVFFLKSMLSNALMEMGGDLYRDFFLDILESAIEQPTSSLAYPLLSFGPGDRYAAKGCYVVQLSAGDKPQLQKKIDWSYYVGRQ
jgi:hypothetical protein